MRITTRRERIIEGIAHYLATYKDNRYGDDKLITRGRLAALDSDTCSAEEVDNIIGNSTWTDNICDECEKDKEDLIIFLEKYENEYEVNPCKICLDCLKEAKKLIEKSKQQSAKSEEGVVK